MGTQNVKMCLQIAIIFIVVLQTCDPPKCPSGFQQNGQCECVRESQSVSECPGGFSKEMELSPYKQQRCVCQRTTEPVCEDASHTLDRGSCECTYSVAPSCPSYTSLSGNAYCEGWKDSVCPRGYERAAVGCKCVETVSRRCSAGSLSDDDCYCNQIEWQPPTCPGGYNLPSYSSCALDTSKCTCSVQCKCLHEMNDLRSMFS